MRLKKNLYVGNEGSFDGRPNRGRPFINKKDWTKCSRRAFQERNVMMKAKSENEFYQEQIRKFKDMLVTPLTDEKIFKSQGPTGINFEEYCKIKVERSGRNADEAKTMVNFSDIDEKLPQFLRRNIKKNEI